MRYLSRNLRTGIGVLLGSFLLFSGCNSYSPPKIKSEESVKETHAKSLDNKRMAGSQQIHNKSIAEPINWQLPTGGPYPVIAPNEPIWIKVSKEKQRVYIMKGYEPVYSMICSSGLDTAPDTSTPDGTFFVQRERGLSFYNESEGEGAKYWVSWKNHGEFLFHSVATDKAGNVIPSEAAKLGKKASHGCIRLSMADAKWIYDHIQYNTKVVIEA